MFHRVYKCRATAFLRERHGIGPNEVTLVEASCQATQKCCVWEVPRVARDYMLETEKAPPALAHEGVANCFGRLFRTQGILLRVPSDIGVKIWGRTRSFKDTRVSWTFRYILCNSPLP